MLQQIIDLAIEEVGNGMQKYEREIFPGERSMPGCLTFLIWLFVQVYGEEEAKKKLYMVDNKFNSSVVAFMTFVKAYNKFHFKSCKVGYIVFLKMTYEWTNHVALVIGMTDDEIITAEGNVNGKVVICRYFYNDIRISGYAEITY